MTVKYEGLKCKIDYTSILPSNHFQRKKKNLNPEREREREREPPTNKEREAGHLNSRSTPSPPRLYLSPPIKQSSNPLPICPLSLFLPLPPMSPIYPFFLYPCQANHHKVEWPTVTQLPPLHNLATTASRLNLRLAHDWSPSISQFASPFLRLSLSLSLFLSLTGFDECFCLVLFLLCLYIKKWYYIFVWKLRKCEQLVENVFSIAFSRTQPNT